MTKCKFTPLRADRVSDPLCEICMKDVKAQGFLSSLVWPTVVFVCDDCAMRIDEDNPLLIPFLRLLNYPRR